jgi:hypothetical protein
MNLLSKINSRSAKIGIIGMGYRSRPTTNIRISIFNLSKSPSWTQETSLPKRVLSCIVLKLSFIPGFMVTKSKAVKTIW